MHDYNDINIDANLLCDLAYENLIEFIKNDCNYTDIMIRSLSYFLEAIEIEGRNYRAHLGLGILLLSGGLYKEAKNFLNNANDMNPSKKIKEYIFLVEEYEYESKKAVSNKKVSNKTAVSDLLDLGNKFKI